MQIKFYLDSFELNTTNIASALGLAIYNMQSKLAFEESEGYSN